MPFPLTGKFPIESCTCDCVSYHEVRERISSAEARCNSTARQMALDCHEESIANEKSIRIVSGQVRLCLVAILTAFLIRFFTHDKPMSASSVTTNAGVHMPRLIYGTAWKKDATTQLVIKAVLNGFRGVDTACQPKHYREDLVGQALRELHEKHNIPRKDLFIQTKFTSIDGQDQSKPLPYNPREPLSTQVRQSFATSLQNLQTDYVDSLVLHGPERTHERTMEVYRECEKFVDEGRVKQLGISNLYDVSRLKRLYDDARHKPAVVQNRFYSETSFDRDIRQFCREKNIYYQSFWTLTANPDILAHPLVKQLAQERRATPAQVFFRFLMDVGLTPLTGTTSDQHMKEDLQVLQWPSLDQDSVAKLKKLIGD